MHDTAMKIGSAFFSSYLGARDASAPAILDVGGLDVNGSLRSAARKEWKYLAIDMEAGKGVDIVLDDPYRFPFPDDSFDAAISTSCFEHDALFWLTFLEMCRVTKKRGYIYLNVPSDGAFHRYPIDAWRFYPDAGLALVTWAQRSGILVTLCEAFVSNQGADGWSDYVAIFRKGRFTKIEIPPIYTSVPCTNIHLLGAPDILTHSGLAEP
jgi:SAM-dependent methyltransferase